ncbi:hypothetical protein ACFYXM_33965 [Streptomyces sp. NPDC002476]|uniref:hypothetical protein n=1 Tax=Streptomyces sp. NPDC002476 TaxID=3364648 RepID=UPI003681A39F
MRAVLVGSVTGLPRTEGLCPVGEPQAGRGRWWGMQIDEQHIAGPGLAVLDRPGGCGEEPATT